MKIPLPYRLATARAAGFGADYFSTGRFTPSSGKNLKMRNFGRVLSNFAPQGIHPGYSAPSPIVPAGKHYTTPTVLSSGEALKKTNSVGVLSNFAPVIAPPFAPGGSPSFPFFLPQAPSLPWRPVGVASGYAEACHCYFPKSQALSLHCQWAVSDQQSAFFILHSSFINQHSSFNNDQVPRPQPQASPPKP